MITLSYNVTSLHHTATGKVWLDLWVYSQMKYQIHIHFVCVFNLIYILDITWMDKEEDDFCTPHKLFNRFSMCTLPSTTTTQTKMEAGADDSDIRQDLHHSSVVGDHIYNSFMFVVFMHFSLYYWFCIDFVIVTDIVIVHSYRPSDVFPQ